MSKSTLSSVVSSLLRASMGTSLSPAVPDEDLDKHVADLILREAKEKADNYSKLGITAYLPSGPDPNAPRPNKRFLSSIIRSTDDHNKTILRAQTLAAQEIKREREEQERRERRARAEEAVAAERSRRRKRRDDYDSDDWDARWTRDDDRFRPRLRAWESDWRRDPISSEDELEREREHKRSRRRHHSRSGSRDEERERDRGRRHRSSHKRASSKERDRDRDSRRSKRSHRKHRRPESRDDERNHKRRRHTTRSPNPEHESKSRKRNSSASVLEESKKSARDSALCNSSTPSGSRSSQTLIEDDTVDVDTESHRPSKGKERDVDRVSMSISPPRVHSPSPPPPPPPRRLRGRPTSSTSVRSPSVSPPPLPPAALPSKMDKYFEDSYDPRLDVAPLSIPIVPKTGLINNSEYEAWDAMLELLRQRREDREEQKRLEKLGFNTSDKKIPTSKLKKYGDDSDSFADITYKKKGSVREWDLGKEGL